MPGWQWQQGDLLLDIYVQPRASRDELSGWHDGALKVRITAAPVDGKANAQLLRFLAGEFGVPRKAVELLSGESGRRKRVRILQPQRLPAGIEPAHSGHEL